MWFPARTVDRLRWALLALMFVCVGLAVPVIAYDPVLAANVVILAIALALGCYLFHEDGVALFLSLLVCPTVGLALFALLAYFDLPLGFMLWLTVGVYAFVMLALTARELPWDPLDGM